MSGGSDLTPREIAVMDLYDRGLGPRAIVKMLGVKSGYVSRVISTFREKDEDHWQRPVICASARLRDACLALQARGGR